MKKVFSASLSSNIFFEASSKKFPSVCVVGFIKLCLHKDINKEEKECVGRCLDNHDSSIHISVSSFGKMLNSVWVYF